jgi:hypothetical protein
MNETDRLEFRVSEVGIDREEFTPGHAVLSIGFALSDEDALIIQRDFGEKSEGEETLCLVRSPSQECAYDAFTRAMLNRDSLTLCLTGEAGKVFGAAEISIAFSLPEPSFSQLAENMAAAFGDQPFYTYQAR